MDPVKASHFRSLLAQAPMIPYNVEPSTQAYIVNEFVKQALIESFPKIPEVRKVSCFLSGPTFSLVCTRASMLQELHYAGRLLAKAPPRFCFLVWQQYFRFYKSRKSYHSMLNNTVNVTNEYVHWICFSKPQAHC